ncbi:class I SAM-dependent methyltransferase [Patescibacteria group bacterium]|nr:class I SAM-dependent methyltransferase [Patescibacteria group bacterium]
MENVSCKVKIVNRADLSKRKEPVFNFVNKFSKEFWFAPQDVFLRATEAILFSRYKFKSPVLDIGCGDGRISKLLFEGHKKLDVGIDISEREIEIAQRNGVYQRALIENAEKMSFKTESFRTVIGNSTFEHIRNDIKAVDEVARVLKKNGLFYLTVPTKRLKKIFTNIMDQNQFKNLNHRLSHFHYRSLEEWERILKRSKLTMVHSEYYFSIKATKAWYRLFKVATFRPYKRELWSYLKDSPYGRLFPKKTISKLVVNYYKKYCDKMFTDKGCWLFIVAKKED